jgi:hypothetical protein
MILLVQDYETAIEPQYIAVVSLAVVLNVLIDLS